MKGRGRNTTTYVSKHGGAGTVRLTAALFAKLRGARSFIGLSIDGTLADFDIRRCPMPRWSLMTAIFMVPVFFATAGVGF